MNILVTGSDGFVGRNLIENLKNIRDGKNRTRPGLKIDRVIGYDVSHAAGIPADASISPADVTADLETCCSDADFVFHFAGVNRPDDPEEFQKGNVGSLEEVLACLKTHHNRCPVMLSSSAQAFLTGRFQDSAYGKSKLRAEETLFRYGEETGAKVLVYRFPNLFGKWCRPHYNSAVATFCHAFAHDLPYTVDDPMTELELVYIDDLVEEMLDALEGNEHRCDCRTDEATGEAVTVPVEGGRFCYVPASHHVTLGEIVEHLQSFKEMPRTLVMPAIPAGSFAKKLYSTYLSYLPQDQVSYGFSPHIDHRGNFTELIRTADCGQFSINVAAPGITRGEHWHNSKWEIFIVVAGHGLIRQRRVGTDPETGKPYPVIEYEVSGKDMRAIQILPGFTHSIVNLSDTEDLVTVMWANEPFDEEHPDTFSEPVDGGV